MDASYQIRQRLPALLLALGLISTSSLGWAQASDNALYLQLGSQAGIGNIVDDLLKLVVQDTRINLAFKDTNMKRLAQLLKEQLCQLSGGPCKYSGDEMKLVHEDLAVSATQFYALTEDLQIAMEAQHITSAAQFKLIAKLAPMQRDIVTKKSAQKK